MRRVFLTTIALVCALSCENILSDQANDGDNSGQEPDLNIIAFEDENFKAYMVADFDKNGDNEISLEEAEKITSIKCNNMDIKSLGGIEYCTGLTELVCSENSIAAFDAKIFHNLETLDCYSNKLKRLDISSNHKLKTFNFHNNPLEYLNIGSFVIYDNETPNHAGWWWHFEDSEEIKIVSTKLIFLDLGHNHLKSIDVSECPSLKYFYCDGNPFEYINLGDARIEGAFTLNDCTDNPIARLEIAGKNVTEIGVMHFPELEFLDVSECPALNMLMCQTCALTELDVRGCNKLTQLYCDDNKLTVIGLTETPAIRHLTLTGNMIRQLNLRENTALEILGIDSNPIKELDLSYLKSLKHLSCSYCEMESLNLSGCSLLESLYWGNNKFEYVNLGNANPKEYNKGWNSTTDYPLLSGIVGKSLEFISGHVTKLDVTDNYDMMSLDVSECPSLDTLYCSSNTNLTELYLKTGQEIANLYKDSKTEIIYK